MALIKFLVPILFNHCILPDVNFKGHYLINIYISVHKKVKNIYIFYILNQWPRDLNTDFTLGTLLFGSVKLTKNTDPDKYIYTAYGTGFSLLSEMSLHDGSVGKNVIIFGADIRSSMYIDKKGKEILILGEGPTQGLDDTTVTKEENYPINFTQLQKIFALSLPYNGRNSFFFVNATKVYHFKAKDSEIKDYILYVDNISKKFSINNMKKTRLKGSVNSFLLILILLILTIFYISIYI